MRDGGDVRKGIPLFKPLLFGGKFCRQIRRERKSLFLLGEKIYGKDKPKSSRRTE